MHGSRSALNALESMLGMNNNGNTTSSSAGQGSLLVALDDLASGKVKMTLQLPECCRR